MHYLQHLNHVNYSNVKHSMRRETIMLFLPCAVHEQGTTILQGLSWYLINHWQSQ